ncbi:MAG: Pycsar system effector family protein [Saprospiraceae bacterium]
MNDTSQILAKAEATVRAHMEAAVSAGHTFHNFAHTSQVVEAAQELGSRFDLTERERELLLIAAWFHDSGYAEGAEDHETRSAEHAAAFLDSHGYSAEDIALVKACILDTRLSAEPRDLLSEILCDADLAHLGKPTFWDLSSRLRHEKALTRGTILTEQEWVNQELTFLQSHSYQTPIAFELYNDEKQRHIRLLHKQRLRLDPDIRISVEEPEKKSKKQKKLLKTSNKELKQLNLGRGVETMYRATYRTHVNLSSIADNKANIMLSINAIIVSIIVSTLVPKFSSDPKLILPTIVLLTVCLLAIVFATLSTRPKITEGRVSREDIEARRSNLLFFGNYYRMSLDDYQYGMAEMIKDNDFLYASMTRDLYFLGVVLAKKYRYLSICYGIFMYGLILAVVVFALAFIIF